MYSSNHSYVLSISDLWHRDIPICKVEIKLWKDNR